MIGNTGINKPQGTTSLSHDPGTPSMGVDGNGAYKFLALDSNGNIVVSGQSGTGIQRVLVDQASATIVYVGYGPYDGDETNKVWLIFRLETTGNVVKKSFANTDVAYDKQWSLRATYTYL